MSFSPDLKIVDNDVRSSFTALDRIASNFEQDAKTAADLGEALGHKGLTDRFQEFSESWRVNRERMAKAFESLSSELRQKLEAFEKLDKEIAGGGDQPSPGPQPTPEQQEPTINPQPGPGPTAPPNGGGGGGHAEGPSHLSEGSQGSRQTGTTPSDGAAGPTSGTAPQAIVHDGGSIDSAPGTSLSDSGQGTVTVDTDNGDFRAQAVIAGVGGVASVATLMGLYKAWERSRSGSDSSQNPGASEGDPRTTLLEEFEKMKLGQGGGTVDLVASGKSPDDVLAVLRGEDGRTATLRFADLDGSREGGQFGTPSETSDVALDGAAGATQSLAPQPTSASETAGNLNAPLAGTGGSGGGHADLGPDLPAVVDQLTPGIAPAEQLASSLPHSPDPTSPAFEPGADSSPSSQGHPSAAGTTAGLGMMGMGMAGAAASTNATGKDRGESARRLDPHPRGVTNKKDGE